MSQHLLVLLEAHTVVRRSEGRQRIYRLDAAAMGVVHEWAAESEQFWQERLSRLRRRLDR